MLKGGEHYFKVAAKTTLVFKAKMQLFKTSERNGCTAQVRHGGAGQERELERGLKKRGEEERGEAGE